jgi:2-phospho-L-lactate guanylyltransferase
MSARSSADPGNRSVEWSLVVPVKVLARAKSRLAALAGPHRPQLALAMAADTVAAALACRAVARVIAVTDDPRAERALSRLGAIVVADEPDDGLNAALRHGAALAVARWPGCGIGALAADLPALRPDELGMGLRAAARWQQAFVPDAAGSGTTLYVVRPPAEFRPRFGPGSARRHRAAGAAELAFPGIESLRRDVDAPADLRVATGLGVGPRTAEVAAKLS